MKKYMFLGRTHLLIEENELTKHTLPQRSVRRYLFKLKVWWYKIIRRPIAPMFEIVTNPEVNLLDIKERRFTIANERIKMS